MAQDSQTNGAWNWDRTPSQVPQTLALLKPLSSKSDEYIKHLAEHVMRNGFDEDLSIELWERLFALGPEKLMKICRYKRGAFPSSGTSFSMPSA